MTLDDRIEMLRRFVEAAGDRDTFPRAVKQELKWLEELREWRKFGDEHGIYMQKNPWIERSRNDTRRTN